MAHLWDERPLIEHHDNVKCCGGMFPASMVPEIRNIQLAVWRNLMIFSLLVLSIVSLATNGGIAYGLMKNAPLMERTSNATLGMRADTKGMIDNGKKKFNELMSEYPPNQMNIWLARGDSMTHSIDTILASIAATVKGRAIDVGNIASNAVKGVMTEFVTQETKRKFDSKMSQFLDALDPAELAGAVKNFNRLMERAEKNHVVDHVDTLLQDVDKSVRDLQKGRKITFEARM